MKKIILLFLISFLLACLLPSFTLAGSYKIEENTVIYQGLVPCGKDTCQGIDLEEAILTEKTEEYQKEGLNSKEALEKACTEQGGKIEVANCEFCHFLVLLEAILNFVVWRIVPLLLVLGLLALALIYFFSLGSPQTQAQAKSFIGSLAKGCLIVFLAWFIVNLFMVVIGYAEWASLQEGWFQIKCETPVWIPPALCGNNKIDPPDETCDGDLLNDKTCLDFGFTNASGLRCSFDCRSFDTSSCYGKTPICGNNEKEEGEECDGTDFGDIKTCHDFKPNEFVAGEICKGDVLKCTEPGEANECQFDTSECIGCDDYQGLANCHAALYPAQEHLGLSLLKMCIIDKCTQDPYCTSLGKAWTFDETYDICNYTRGERICPGQNCTWPKYSCHYGGITGKGALAVDFDAIHLFAQIQVWAQECNSEACVFMDNQNNRVTVSLPTLGNCPECQ